MANKKRRCTHCKKYKAASEGITAPVGFFCDSDCRMNYAMGSTKKLMAKSSKITAAKKSKQHKEDKERVKTKSEWLAELQTMFNKYIRLRDKNNGCISCDKDAYWQGQYHAGHYYSRGHSSFLRFNLWNVHKQCSVCNNHLSGNIGEYTPKLIDKIGQERFDYLMKNKSKVASFDVDWIKRAKVILRKKIKLIDS